ncbi:MAG: alpha/beta hydrolase, partial [Faecalibacterium sp.]|nr:alpha/beta hydrolase [Faecalibacterium sp.]
AAWHVQPDKIAVCGFSAGGHLALSGAVLAVPGLPEQPRPGAVILGYPVITAGQYAHRGSFVQLAGEDPAAQQAFSLEDKITPRTPPVFVWHTMEDETVPVENTLLLVSALHRAGVPCEAHLFEKGCHGTSLSTAEVNHPSAHRSRWLTLAREWLDDTFDFHLGTGETGG